MIGVRHLKRIDGVLLMDKPVGPSSNAVLQHVKRLYSAQRAGHTGTLDPLASGLLTICFGEATKFGSHLLEAEKGYIANIRLGVRTATGDAEGEILEVRPADVDRESIETVLNSFLGDGEQIPPMHSALKKDGRPLYELARKGLSVERPARRVSIRKLELRTLNSESATVYVRCSKGTYVRTLAEDIGLRLGCGAHLSQLRRVEIGSLSVDDAVAVDRLEGLDFAARLECLLPVEYLVAALPRIDLGGLPSRRFESGQNINLEMSVGTGLEGLVRVYGPTGVFIGVAVVDGQGRLLPRRLMAPRPCAERNTDQN